MRAAACAVLLICVSVALHCASAVEVEAPRKIRIGGADKPKAPTSCGDNKEKHDCLHLGAQEGECAWCAGDFMPGSCVSTWAAKYIPDTVAKCKLPKKHKAEQLADAEADNKKGGASAACARNKGEDDCLVAKDPECAWCAGQYMTPKCIPSFKAKFIPEMIAECKFPQEDDADDDDDDDVEVAGANADKPKPKPKAPTSCGDNKDKHDCLHLGSEEGECAWCVGDFMPGSCINKMATKYIPETVAKCKLPKKHKAEQVTAEKAKDDADKPKPKAPTSCGDNKEKHDCLHLGAQEGECAWCAGDFMPGSCVSTWAAKYIPDMVAKCKLPKKAESVESSGGGYGPGGGDWPSGGGGQGGCMDLKSKKKCLKGDKDEACAWCSSSYMGDTCISESQVDYYKYFAKCKIGKKHKKDAVAIA